MSERADLLESIAATIEDYREGEIDRPTPEHVDRWVSQFDEPVQVPLLREFSHVLDETYLSRTWVHGSMKPVLLTQQLAGDDPPSFWKGTTFLNIQGNGHSQEELLPVLGDVLTKECGVGLHECSSGPEGPFVYFDDVLFSGGRVGADLSAWIRDQAPQKCTLHAIFFAVHSLGAWQARTRLDKVAEAAGKAVEIHVWRAFTIENRKKYRKDSEVLWPAVVPDDAALKAYLAGETRFPFEAREPGGKGEHGIFSSEEGRQLVEREFLMKGMYIRSLSQNPSPAIRPLGFGAFGLGFGSTIVTFRNCPNNAPLCLWWGDPSYPDTHPFSKWYPLFPRKTYEDTATVDIDFDFDL